MTAAFQIKPEVSINTVLAVGAVIGVVYFAYKLKQGVGDVADNIGNWWEGVDLNPFDLNGSLSLSPKTEPDSLQTAARKAMAAKGKNIDEYRFYYPAIEGQKLPAGAWTITYQNKTHYLVPKKPLFGTFTL